MYLPKNPLVLSVELTDRCNLNCRHCLADANYRQASLTPESVKKIINEAAEAGVGLINLGGGEPLLYAGFFEVCQLILDRGMRIFFATNGLLISDQFSLLMKLKKYHRFIQVGVSLDGHTPDLHGYFRPKDSFPAAVEAIRILTTAGFKTTVMTVLNRENSSQIPAFLQYLVSIGVNNVRLLPFMPVGRGRDFMHEMLSPEEIHGLFQENNKQRLNLNINLGSHYPWEFLFKPPGQRKPAPCEAGYLRLWINACGEMMPCSYMTGVSLGNINTKTITDVWRDSPVMKALREPALLKGHCAVCEYKEGCRGGCRGLAFALEGDYLCSDPYCPIVVQNKNVQV